MTFQEHGDHCATSRTLPSLDLMFLGTEVGGAIVGDALRTGSGLPAHRTVGGVLIGASLAAAVVQAASAHAGFRWADECTVKVAPTTARR